MGTDDCLSLHFKGQDIGFGSFYGMVARMWQYTVTNFKRERQDGNLGANEVFLLDQPREIHQIITAGELFEVHGTVMVLAVTADLDAPKGLEPAVSGPVRQGPHLFGSESVVGYVTAAEGLGWVGAYHTVDELAALALYKGPRWDFLAVWEARKTAAGLLLLHQAGVSDGPG